MHDDFDIDELAAADIEVPDNIADFVEVLGIARTMQFLLNFGGAELYFGPTPGGRGRFPRMFGLPAAVELGRRRSGMSPRVPLAKPWMAAVMRASGAPTAAIARRLLVTDVTVRKWLD